MPDLIREFYNQCQPLCRPSSLRGCTRLNMNPSIILILMAGFAKKKYFKLAKGFFGRAKNCHKVAIQKVEKSLQYAYRGRRIRPRIRRREWITTVGAAARDHNLRYGQFAHALAWSNIKLDRKILADLAVNEPFTFKVVADELRLQMGIPVPRPLHTIEDMIQANLVIRTRLPDSSYVRVDKPIQTEFLLDEKDS